MTVVAAFTVNGVPVMLGDLLISGPSTGRASIHIPTVGDAIPSLPEDGQLAIAQLRQKLCIIGDNIALGWSGSLLAATMVVEGLIKENRRSEMTLEEVKRYLDNLDKWTRQQDLSLVGYVSEPAGIAPFGYNCSEFQSDIFGNVMVSGTGESDLSSLLQQFSTSAPQFRGEDANPLAVAACTALTVTGFLLQSELADDSALDRFYGGGYEVVTFVNGRFGKINDITYLVWILSTDGQTASLALPSVVIKYSYERDLLIMRVARFNRPSEEDEPTVALSNELYVVTPIYRYPKQTELTRVKQPRLSSRFLCNYVVVLPRHKKLDVTNVVCRVDLSTQSPGPIEFIEEEDKVALAVSKSFIEEIFSLAIQSLKSDNTKGIV